MYTWPAEYYIQFWLYLIHVWTFVKLADIKILMKEGSWQADSGWDEFWNYVTRKNIKLVGQKDDLATIINYRSPCTFSFINEFSGSCNGDLFTHVFTR